MIHYNKKTMFLNEILFTLLFITIFIIVHYVFKNIKDICLWSCKFLTTVYLWSLVWIVTQLHRLPEWQASFSDSVWKVVNMTNINMTKFEL